MLRRKMLPSPRPLLKPLRSPSTATRKLPLLRLAPELAAFLKRLPSTEYFPV
jgi:hypothetical protein